MPSLYNSMLPYIPAWILFGAIIVLIVWNATKIAFTAYFTEKGKGLATKQDISEITEKVEQIKNDLGFTNQIRLNTKAEERAALIDFYEKLNSWYIEVRDFGLEFKAITDLEIPVIEDNFTSAKLHERLDLLTKSGAPTLVAKSKVDLYVDIDSNKDLQQTANEILANMQQSRMIATENYVRYHYSVQEFFTILKKPHDASYHLNIKAATAVLREVNNNYDIQARSNYEVFHKLLPLLRKTLHKRLISSDDYMKSTNVR